MMFDFYLDEKSNCSIVFSPAALDRILREEVAMIEMTRRTGLLDLWELEHVGPATSFHSLQESHVRVETWPAEFHVNGEVQLCNFSRDNEQPAKRLVRHIIGRLNPATARILCIKRGPGTPLHVSDSVDWKRGNPLPF